MKKRVSTKKSAAERPTKLVRVSFFRAVQRERIGDDWSWPANGDIRAALVRAFDDGNGELNDWPFTTYWGRSLLVEIHDRDAPVQFGVSTVRNDALPLVLKAGAHTGEPLTLDERDRLLEPTYATFFDDGVVGLVKAEHSPGHSMVGAALAQLTKVDVELVPIPRPDIVQAVQQGSGVTSLDLTVAAGSIDVAAENDDLVRAAEALRYSVPGSEKVMVRLTAETAQQKRQLRSRALNLLRGRGVEGLAAAHARVITDDAGSEIVDLLEDDISTSARVEVSARTRYLLPSEAHAAAVQAFDLQQTAITRSIALAN